MKQRREKMSSVKTPRENLLNVLQGKKVLFIENDHGLYNGLERLEDFLKENKIEYKCLFDVQKMPFENIVKAISENDAIVFQTQWVYEIARKLSQFLQDYKEKKIVIEVPVGADPTWYYLPKGVVHDLYFLQLANKDTWYQEDKFLKITDKPYWDYENNFDK